MGNLTNQLGYVTNTFFSGGEIVTPLTGTAFAWQNEDMVDCTLVH